MSKCRIASHCITGTVLLLLLSGFTAPIVRDRSYYEPRGDIIWDLPMEEKLIAFTFDDGPHEQITPQILDLLKQYDAKATFFVIGNRIEKHRDIILREASEGHEIGNHTYNHVFFNKRCNPDTMHEEVERTKQKLLEIAGTDSPWFRPPGGYYNDDVVAVAKQHKYTVLLWSWHQDTEDWKAPGVNKIVQKVLNNARNGDIVLMHDNVKGSDQTLKALQIILPELKERGFRFVTVSQLMERQYLTRELEKFQLQ